MEQSLPSIFGSSAGSVLTQLPPDFGRMDSDLSSRITS